MADVTMPQLGETVTEGTITKWFKQVGDQVAEDEVLFEVSTDKVDSEVPSPVSGYVSEIKVPEGDTVDVGAVLAVISDGPPSGGGGEAPAAKAEPAPEQEPEPEPEAEEAQPEPEPEPEPQAEAPQPQAQPQPEPAPVAESAPSAAPAERQPAEAAPAPAASSSSESKLLSPVVRRLIAEHKLDPSTIKGTGAGGRITRNDVQAVIEGGGAAKAPAPAAPAPAPAPAPAATVPARPGERDTAIPHSNIRRRTAEHMLRSKQTSAHVYVSIEVDYEGVEQVRREQRDAWK